MAVKSILIVDDEKSFLAFLAETLAMEGFLIQAADSPRAAIDHAAGLNDTLDLLLVDVVMPGMNGKDLAGRIAVLRPETRVLFMSAYSNDIITTHGVLPPGADLIHKPFQVEELIGKIGLVLAKARPWSAQVSTPERGALKSQTT